MPAAWSDKPGSMPSPFSRLREKATSAACGARLQPRSRAVASEITMASVTVSEAASAIDAEILPTLTKKKKKVSCTKLVDQLKKWNYSLDKQ